MPRDSSVWSALGPSDGAAPALAPAARLPALQAPTAPHSPGAASLASPHSWSSSVPIASLVSDSPQSNLLPPILPNLSWQQRPGAPRADPSGHATPGAAHHPSIDSSAHPPPPVFLPRHSTWILGVSRAPPAAQRRPPPPDADPDSRRASQRLRQPSAGPQGPRLSLAPSARSIPGGTLPRAPSHRLSQWEFPALPLPRNASTYTEDLSPVPLPRQPSAAPGPALPERQAPRTRPNDPSPPRRLSLAMGSLALPTPPRPANSRLQRSSPLPRNHRGASLASGIAEVSGHPRRSVDHRHRSADRRRTRSTDLRPRIDSTAFAGLPPRTQARAAPAANPLRGRPSLPRSVSAGREGPQAPPAPPQYPYNPLAWQPGRRYP